MSFDSFSLFSIVFASLTYIYMKNQKQKNIKTYDDQQIYKEMELNGLTF